MLQKRLTDNCVLVTCRHAFFQSRWQDWNVEVAVVVSRKGSKLGSRTLCSFLEVLFMFYVKKFVLFSLNVVVVKGYNEFKCCIVYDALYVLVLLPPFSVNQGYHGPMLPLVKKGCHGPRVHPCKPRMSWPKGAPL